SQLARRRHFSDQPRRRASAAQDAGRWIRRPHSPPRHGSRRHRRTGRTIRWGVLISRVSSYAEVLEQLIQGGGMTSTQGLVRLAVLQALGCASVLLTTPANANADPAQFDI